MGRIQARGKEMKLHPMGTEEQILAEIRRRDREDKERSKIYVRCLCIMGPPIVILAGWTSCVNGWW